MAGRLSRWLVVVLVLCLICATDGGALAQPALSVAGPIAEPATARALGSAGASFALVENVGQFAADVRFRACGGGGTLWLTDDSVWFTAMEPDPRAADANRASADAPSGGVHLRLSFEGASPTARLEPLGRVATRYAFFLGDDPERWREDVPAWGAVRYAELYPGVDLLISASADGWSWSLVATGDAQQRAHALEAVQLRVEGADALSLAERGALLAHVGERSVALPWLQVLDADLLPVSPPSGQPRLVGEVVVAPFAAPLAHVSGDAVLAEAGDLYYSTYLGGTDIDTPRAIAVDASGQAYLTGEVWSPSFPATPGAFDASHAGGFDAFISKLSADGTTLVYHALIGGVDGGGGDDEGDHGLDIAIDDDGRTYITGYTTSPDYPTTAGAFQEVHGGNKDAFVSVLNPAGTALVYSTLLGGGNGDYGHGIALGAAGQAYLVGLTRSPNYPTTAGAYQEELGGPAGVADAFVTVLNATGSDLVYSTLLGGTLEDHARAVAVDGAGRAFVAGGTTSADMPTTPGAYQTTLAGESDAFVAVLNPAGSGLVYATLLGGGDADEPNAIAVDRVGRAYVTGATAGDEDDPFPTTPGAYNTAHSGGRDLFVAALIPDGTGLHYGALLGGHADDWGQDLVLDDAGRAYIACTSMETTGASFPTTTGAYATAHHGASDAVLVVLSPDGADLAYSSFFGGSSLDQGTGIARDTAGRVYLAGQTDSDDLLTTPGAIDTTFAASWDTFVACLDASPSDLAVTKVVDWSAMSPDVSQLFTVTLTGPSHPGGDSRTVGHTGGTLTWTNLVPGIYTLDEVDPGIGWGVAISDPQVTISGGVDATATITNTFRPGGLVLTKAVDWSGITPIPSQTFALRITGPSYPSGNTQTVGHLGGTVAWPSLAAGTYTVSEVNPGVAWDVQGSGAQVVISDGITATARITNTYQPGSLTLSKVVNWSGIPPQPGGGFSLTITGPSYPTGDIKSVGANGGSVTWSHLEPGAYTVDEVDPGVAWQATGRGAQVTVSGGVSATATITNVYQPGSLTVTKLVDWTGTLPDPTRVFTIAITGPSHPTGSVKTVGYTGGEVAWSGLAPGTYTVAELDPPDGWYVGGNGMQVTVSGGVNRHVTLTNSYRKYLYLPLIVR